MTRINLLPWREERRKQQERQFYNQLALMLVLGLAAVVGWSLWMGMRIDNQQTRNEFLRAQIREVDAKIVKIKALEKTRAELLSRKEIIEKLQANRSQMVHLFDEVVKSIPDSVTLTSMGLKGQSLSIDGVAESNASVATYMRRMERSPWFGKPVLRKTQNRHDGSRMPYAFSVVVAFTAPQPEAEGAGVGEGKAARGAAKPAGAS